MIITVDLEKDSLESLRKAIELLQDAADRRDGGSMQFDRPAPPSMPPPEPRAPHVPPATVFDLSDMEEEEPPKKEAKQEKKSAKKDILTEAGIQVY